MSDSGVCVMGAINLDLVTFTDAIPRGGETVQAQGSARFLGGKAANQAVASIRQGAATRLIGAVGGDADGAWLQGELRAAGLDLDGVTVLHAAPSGFAHVCVAAGGENAIVVVGGANAALDPARVAAAASRSGAAAWLTQLETSLACSAAFLLTAETVGGVRILNAAPARADARPLLGLADVLVVNEHELAAFTGATVATDPLDVAAAAHALRSGPEQAVVVTLGAQGLVAVHRDAVIRLPGRRVQAVDTTGAGDGFCGGLAAALASGLPLAAALERASAGAALSVTRTGAAASMPTTAEVDAALRDWGAA